MDTNKYGAISSSVNSQEISTTVLSLAKLVSGLLVGFGVITVAQDTTLTTQIPAILTDVIALVPIAYAMWHSAEMVFGVIQKVLVAIFKKPQVLSSTPVTVVNP